MERSQGRTSSSSTGASKSLKRQPTTDDEDDDVGGPKDSMKPTFMVMRATEEDVNAAFGKDIERNLALFSHTLAMMATKTFSIHDSWIVDSGCSHVYNNKSNVQAYANEILDKLNQIHHIAKTTISDDLTLIKNASQVQWHAPAQTNSKEREIIVKLHNPEAAALLRDKTPGDLRERVNNALKERAGSMERPIQVVAAKQLKSGDVSIHTVNIEDANKLREEQQWTQALGREARARQPPYGVLVHSVRTDKENIDPSNQSRSVEKIQTKNATLYPGATITYVGWLTRTGAKKPTSSLVLEFATKEHADRAIREGLVLDACYHHCELYHRSCKLKQCYKCQKYGHIGAQCNANETCGYCAEPHNTRDCRKKEDPNSTSKCALCKEPHAAWSSNCLTRQAEITKVEQARRIRPSYYIEPDAASKVAQPATRPTLPLFTGGTLRRTLDQRKRPAETLPTERTTARPRRNPQLNVGASACHATAGVLAIVVPQITYACSVWHTPRGERGLTEKMRTTLDRIQREGARIVGRAYRAASGAALDVELFITPLRLQLEERAHDAALNILTGNRFQNEDDNGTSAWTPPIRGDSLISPLTRLYNSLEMTLGERAASHLESRIPFPVKPWWRAPTVTIAEDREAAERLHTHIISGADPPLAVYTEYTGKWGLLH
ncbi:hypothetical protein ACJ73_08809 [Blastomyces percursus]|uniref:CCHC-type domain-containing protein n=1 Tax=Blastomyces percursus TaxID=1658174 RepID=A0A1J9QPY5_9EURO|nr:hypothetical protein ACJ73_08809 [Blastomyces percursus]